MSNCAPRSKRTEKPIRNTCAIHFPISFTTISDSYVVQLAYIVKRFTVNYPLQAETAPKPIAIQRESNSTGWVRVAQFIASSSKWSNATIYDFVSSNSALCSNGTILKANRTNRNSKSRTKVYLCSQSFPMRTEMPDLGQCEKLIVGKIRSKNYNKWISDANGMRNYTSTWV